MQYNSDNLQEELSPSALTPYDLDRQMNNPTRLEFDNGIIEEAEMFIADKQAKLET